MLIFLCSVIQFYLKFGCSEGSNSSASEPVLLRYSTDGGIHWRLIGRYDVQAFTTASYVVVKIPYEAKTNATRIHWWQPISDALHRVDWTIEQVNKIMFWIFLNIFNQFRCITLLPTMLLNSLQFLYERDMFRSETGLQALRALFFLFFLLFSY